MMRRKERRSVSNCLLILQSFFNELKFAFKPRQQTSTTKQWEAMFPALTKVHLFAKPTLYLHFIQVKALKSQSFTFSQYFLLFSWFFTICFP